MAQQPVSSFPIQAPLSSTWLLGWSVCIFSWQPFLFPTWLELTRVKPPSWIDEHREGSRAQQKARQDSPGKQVIDLPPDWGSINHYLSTGVCPKGFKYWWHHKDKNKQTTGLKMLNALTRPILGDCGKGKFTKRFIVYFFFFLSVLRKTKCRLLHDLLDPISQHNKFKCSACVL